MSGDSKLKCGAVQESRMKAPPEVPRPRVGLTRGARLWHPTLGLPFRAPR